jgi:hypothetical protein
MMLSERLRCNNGARCYTRLTQEGHVLLLRTYGAWEEDPELSKAAKDGMTTIDIDDFDSFWQLQAAKHPTSVVVKFLLAKRRLYTVS